MKYIGKICLSSFLALLTSLFAFFGTKNDVNNSLAAQSEGESVMCSTLASGEEVRISSRILELLFGKKDAKEAKNAEGDKVLLLCGGTVFGAKVKQSHITVSDPGNIRELKSGDRILSADGQKISSSIELKKIVSDSEGRSIELGCKRGTKCFSVKVTPKFDGADYSLGIILKDGAAGIGTITYIDPETGIFGGLGHGICDPESGEIIEMTNGEVVGVVLGGVKKGECGKPGELSGILTDKIVGTLYANTECGVFGKLDRIPENLSTSPIEIAHRSEVHAGEASILSTVKNGKCAEFKVEISEVNNASEGTKSFKIKATDPALLAITGGVVRGMSGSPIIQDGKLVGAVTHVMVADPTEGYGIFIENMLNAANIPMAKAS